MRTPYALLAAVVAVVVGVGVTLCAIEVNTMPKAMRVCSTPNCPELTTGGPCATHRRQADQARGSRQQRGYDRAHERRRDALLRNYKPGQPCPVCNQPMLPGQELDAGHSVDLRDNPKAVADRLEHAACNRGWRRGTSR